MKQKMKAIGLMVTAIAMPFFSMASGLGDTLNGMHGVLDQIYDEMIPLCGQLIGVAQGIAGFAATWYIAARVWRHIANAEPIDFYPLFRPFVLGFCIMIFPSVLGLINGVMKPTVTGTAALVEGSNKTIAVLLQRKEEAMKQSDPWQMYVGPTGFGDRDRWYKYTHANADPAGESFIASIGNDIKFFLNRFSYDMRFLVAHILNDILNVIFQAAALCVDTLRTFHLVVLAIIGPFAFGISVFDGFQHTLNAWIARYINIFLWLPVANIFGAIIGKIQEKMIAADLANIANYGDTFFSEADIAYLVFMIIAIVGYTTVPSIANSIVNIGGGSALTQKVNNIFGGTTQSVINAPSTVASTVANTTQSTTQSQSSNTYMGGKISG